MLYGLSVIRFRRRGCFKTEFQGKISGPGWGRFQTHVRGISDAEKGAFQAQLKDFRVWPFRVLGF